VQDQVLAFSPSGPFRAEFLLREYPVGLHPVLPMAVRFSSPVPAAASERSP
jgi:hypothetical protein